MRCHNGARHVATMDDVGALTRNGTEGRLSSSCTMLPRPPRFRGEQAEAPGRCPWDHAAIGQRGGYWAPRVHRQSRTRRSERTFRPTDYHLAHDSGLGHRSGLLGR